jgi:hypothetical protein
MKTLLVVLFLVVPCSIHAEESKWKWTGTDTAYQAATVLLMATDWSQTSWMMRQSRAEDAARQGSGLDNDRHAKPMAGRNEANPLLDDHPSQGRINTYFVATIAAHTVIARLLPKPYRRVWQAIYIVTEAGFVAHNFSIGARVEF